MTERERLSAEYQESRSWVKNVKAVIDARRLTHPDLPLLLSYADLDGLLLLAARGAEAPILRFQRNALEDQIRGESRDCEHDTIDGDRCDGCGALFVVCVPCSVASGAERDIQHMYPACPDPVDGLRQLIEPD